MRSTNRQSAAASLLRGSAVAAAVIVAGLVGNAVGTYVTGAPQVGSIIAFEPSSRVATDKGIRLAVLRADGDGCTLALNVMRRSGGSLVIESQAASDPITFRVHWAGERTSDDGADCGPRADLTVRRHHLDLLASYAGGYGAGPERAAVYAPAMLQ